MEAGLELFGTLGYARTSVRTISAAASLNSRYFYESFSTREDLLYAIYQRIVTEIFTRVAQAVAAEDTLEGQTRAGLRAAWTTVTEDRRKARIVALEVVGVNERLERLRHETRQALAQLTADNAMRLAGNGVQLRLDPVLTARFLMGGVVEILLEWINGDLAAPVDEVVDHFTALFTAAAYAAIAPGDKQGLSEALCRFQTSKPFIITALVARSQSASSLQSAAVGACPWGVRM
jgi:AcrR family transcriptional regulator